MAKAVLFLLLFAMSYQVAASQSYEKLMNLVRQNISTEWGKPIDLRSHEARVIYSTVDSLGFKSEILELSDTLFRLHVSLTDAEKRRFPSSMLIAQPGTYAMRFYCEDGYCSKIFVTTTLPTVDELNLKQDEVRF